MKAELKDETWQRRDARRRWGAILTSIQDIDDYYKLIAIVVVAESRMAQLRSDAFVKGEPALPPCETPDHNRYRERGLVSPALRGGNHPERHIMEVQ